MKEQFATYEVALAMKELGFNEPCLGYFPNVENSDKTMIFFDRVPEYTTNNLFDENPTNYHFTAPLWQQCIDWFREKHNIHISIPNYYDGWSIDIRGFKQNINLEYHSEPSICLENYYETREQAILKAIELCKKK